MFTCFCLEQVASCLNHHKFLHVRRHTEASSCDDSTAASVSAHDKFSFDVMLSMTVTQHELAVKAAFLGVWTR